MNLDTSSQDDAVDMAGTPEAVETPAQDDPEKAVDERADTTAGDGAPPAPESIWVRLRGLLTGAGTPAERARRLYELDRAIEDAPDAPANYLLRGECRFQDGDLAGAQADFQQAYQLAAQAVEGEDWGIVAQAVQDRALHALLIVERAMKKAGIIP